MAEVEVKFWRWWCSEKEVKFQFDAYKTTEIILNTLHDYGCRWPLPHPLRVLPLDLAALAPHEAGEAPQQGEGGAGGRQDPGGGRDRAEEGPEGGGHWQALGGDAARRELAWSGKTNHFV